ncbi:NUDIX hydrolase [Lysinibacillus fusiformis]|uniref:NUDIX hydrolase n=1 Tax=Lysinibacillus fusiformis TaxID=28031 RepID=UPI0012486311|nr:NUDIX domain-containing protein [Lysinibacillus fusiformis]MDC6267424.1 NUDIX domain-containing protein [Lysinibacillus sphaericus]KAB0443768.1 DNA mismatch repair protein MutT [Lysinibacillus fusiformis]MCT6818752.1 NUDIX domain-containing protein [Lysinibacillus fusiformis]MCT6927137.1 NUDIX domain-containing protein [Lysinibacillus fusiformis]MCT6931471.1 NUDIX domain-containing protein [Lysinibacillus fusiformis]
MQVIEKAFGYITREHGEQIQVLVFEQNTVGAGIQVPKGTIEEGETPLEAVKREMLEETGLTTLVVQELIAQDYFNHPSGVLQKRYFYHLTISGETKDTWQHYPTGLNEADLLFSFYWISAEQDTLLAKGHGDYLYRVLAKVKN